MRYLIGLTGLMLISGCATYNLPALEAYFGPQLEWSEIMAKNERDIDETYRDLPFDSGAVYVLANEHGDLHTYSLTPCGGTRICGESGRVGQVERTPDYFVVTGAYRDRTFYLSPGGDGYLTWRGENRDLAWN